MIRKFRIRVQGVCYEVEVEQLTSAAVEAKGITPPPVPKKTLDKKDNYSITSIQSVKV